MSKNGWSDEKRNAVRAKASCFLLVYFNDNGRVGMYSHEYFKPRIRNINDAINEFFRIFNKSFQATAISAAIFDTRTVNMPAAKEHKIYQFENGFWKQVGPVSW